MDPEQLAFSWSGFDGDKPILGKIRDDRFHLRRRRYYRNDLAPNFYGRFVADGRNTRIEGAFRSTTGARVGMIGWFLFVVVFTLVAAAKILTGRSEPGENQAMSLAVPLGMIVFGVLLIRFSWWLARGERKDIVSFLETTFEATEV